MYHLNDVVKVKDRNGNFVQATILQRADFTEKTLWWVKFGDEVTIFDEDILIDWNRKRECVCGALVVGSPGHTYYCDYI